MLLLVDLDNTLVDRASAFNSWSVDFVRLLRRPDSEAAWLIESDRDGYEPRDSLARAIKERFRLDTAVEDLVDRLLYEHVDSMTMEDCTKKALKNAKEHGWKIAIVTNGTTTQQTLKIQRVGLEPYVDAVVISEAERVKKPDSKIFQIAAQRLNSELTGGWMVGDHPTADIAGGQAAGLETGWVSRGMEWPKQVRSPTLMAATAAEVIDNVVHRSALAS
ncbi:HAD superfamily hydrolase (TIGR01662 family) [Arthrobacter silviterrae]|uniref:HAD family hydrolase n=1 Tax=Arthrobacter silviterrae TaxID=2026658 RepID=A0ABX0DCV2_9MICC|nr:HAD family hydrolase [Arthrobacter silviterrae]MDQ0279514.1 HAD superfamily hydrolase (TIGR01662 family) [Arthrobacter silviterrae]NGN82007.1 HAD family hydrolase [Arthrobacter silviterrae]